MERKLLRSGHLLKRLLAASMAVMMALALVGFNTAQASSVPASRVRLAGHYVQFDGTQPIHQGGRILVPIRGVFTLMGFTPAWDNQTNTATLYNGYTLIVLTIGLPYFTVNGRVVTPDVPQMNVGGRVLIPLGAITAAIGGGSSWDDTNRVAVLSPPPELLETTLENIRQLGGATTGATPSITTTSLPAATVGEPYAQTLTASGATPTWTIIGGRLPAGLSLSPNTGVISGTPTAEGTYPITVRALNSYGNHVRMLSIVVERGGPATHTVTFNANGGTGTMTPQTFLHNTAQALRANTFTRTGYTFRGWGTTPTGTAVQYTNSQSIAITADRTLYAVWVRGHTVTFNANGGSGTMQPQVFQTNVAQNLTANAFTRTGYAFAGWRTTPTGTAVQYTNSQNITVAANRTLYAVWVRGNVVTFNANGGTGTMQPQTFQTNVAQYLALNAFTRAGFVFMGWRSSPSGNVEFTDGHRMTVNASRTLYAVWAEGHTVTFNANGGTGTMAPQGFQRGTWQNLRENTFTRAGFVFDGWATSSTGPLVHTDRAAITVTSNTTLFARWVSGINVTTSHLHEGTVGVAYERIQLAATGATQFNWTVSAGFPPGLTLSSAGLITGTPTTAGTFSFTVRATNAQNAAQFGERALTIVVRDGLIQVPNVVGLARRDLAETALSNAGLRYDAVGGWCDTSPIGQIIDQHPAAGTWHAPNTQVTFTINMGPPTVTAIVVMSHQSTFHVGEWFNLDTALTVAFDWIDGRRTIADNTTLNIQSPTHNLFADFDINDVGPHEVTVSAHGFSVSFTITVVP